MNDKEKKAVADLEANVRGLDPEQRKLAMSAFEKVEAEGKSAETEAARLRALAMAGRPADNLGRPTAKGETLGGVRVVKSGEKLFDSIEHADLAPGVKASELSLGRWAKGIVTGNWDGAHAEKQMAIGETTLGGYLVPSALSAQVLDLARAKSTVFRSGAITLPMSTSTLRVAKLVKDPTGIWKIENEDAEFSDLEFDAVELRAKTLVAITRCSIELFEDAIGLENVLRNALAQALAGELDRACLLGSGEAEEPKGILNTLGVHAIEPGLSALADYDAFSDAVLAIAESNGPDPEELAVILNPREMAVLDKLRDEENRPYLPAPSFAAMKKFSTTKIPAEAGEVLGFVGHFPSLAVGMRTNLVIEFSRHAAAGSDSAFKAMQIWTRCYLRGDAAVLRPDHFAIVGGPEPEPEPPPGP